MNKKRENLKRFANACKLLILKGFIPIGKWLFEKNNKIYDLSASDLTQLDRIEKEGLFLVN